MARSLALALVFLPLMLAGCEDLTTSPLLGARTAREIPVEITGLTMHSHTGDRLDHIVRADRSELYQRGQRAVLEEFSLEFFEPGSEEAVSTLEADHGEVNLETNTCVALAEEELIRITRRDQGTVLYTRDFHYDPEVGELYTADRFILLSRQRDGSFQELRGQEIRTDRGLNWVEFNTMRQRGLGHIDLEEYEREIRPLNPEPTP
jgi:hypothetical protein